LDFYFFIFLPWVQFLHHLQTVEFAHQIHTHTHILGFAIFVGTLHRRNGF